MKRFFFVFSIIMTAFLALASGAIAAVEYGAIRPSSPVLQFTASWGITLIEYTGPTIKFPTGDVMLIKRCSVGELKQGSIVLYIDTNGAGIKSGYVESKTDGGFTIAVPAGSAVDIPSSNLVGLYRYRLPHLADGLGALRSTLVIGILSAVLVLSIVLWLALPDNRKPDDGLSQSDEDIASILY